MTNTTVPEPSSAIIVATGLMILSRFRTGKKRSDLWNA
jgi:hypothetical protein